MLQEADLAMTNAAMGQVGGNARFRGDENVYVQFSYHPVKNARKSLEEGRDIFEETPYVKIMVPGDKDNVINRPVRPTDKERWPKHWAHFQNKEKQPQEGTPLSEWAGVSRSQVEELKFFGVFTVEQLASMPDSHNKNFIAISYMKQKARDYVEAAKSDAPFAQIRAENEELKDQITALTQAVEDLKAIEAAKPKTTRKKSDGKVQDDK